MVKIAIQCINVFLYVLILQSLLYPYGDFHHTAQWNSQQYIVQITKQYGNRQCGNYCHTQYVVCYHTHSKNIDKCGENPQNACRKPIYHTKCPCATEISLERVTSNKSRFRLGIFDSDSIPKRLETIYKLLLINIIAK